MQIPCYAPVSHVLIVLQTRVFEMEFNPSYSEADSFEETEHYIRSLAAGAAQAVLGDMAFILSRQDIAVQVETLRVAIWSDMWIESAGWSPEDEDAMNLLLPISHRLAEVVASMPNLRHLKLSKLFLTQDLTKHIFSLPNLVELDILDCTVVGQHDLPLPSSSLPNLRLWIGSDIQTSVWDILPPLVGLRWISLCLSESTNGAIQVIPSLATAQRWNPFTTIEKAYISGLAPFEWDDLTAILEAASVQTRGQLPLTHLKLSFPYGITNIALANLLRPLEGSALRFLVIDGIRDVSPDLIGIIAHILPGLRSLTLYNRDSTRQLECKETIWPYPTWEYAQQLAQFPFLTHFGWNYSTSSTLTYASPAFLRMFEDDSPDILDDSLDGLQETWNEGVISMAKLLVSYAPRLESLGIFRRSTCRIERSPLGEVSFRMVELFRELGGEIHDPDITSSSWPLAQVVERK